jgi:hypothetical protein
MNVEDDPLQLFLGDGQQAASSQIAIH